MLLENAEAIHECNHNSTEILCISTKAKQKPG